MSGSTYVQRALTITLTLGKGTIGQTGFNTVKLAGLRCSATINKGGSPSNDGAEIRVYGVTPSIMNSVSTLGLAFTDGMVRFQNTVTVEAGDAVNGMAVIYQGAIRNAWVNLQGTPETFLHIIGIGAHIWDMAPVPPTSLPASFDVATILAGMANQMGMDFENSGVTVQSPSIYLAGTIKMQAQELADAADINIYFDTNSTLTKNTMAIWPRNKTRNGVVPLISAATGLVSYPQFNDQGIQLRTLFNRNVRIGGQIQVQTNIAGPPASAQGSTFAQVQQAGPNGTWYVRGPLTHDLSAQIPDGPWFTDIIAARVVGA